MGRLCRRGGDTNSGKKDKSRRRYLRPQHFVGEPLRGVEPPGGRAGVGKQRGETTPREESPDGEADTFEISRSDEAQEEEVTNTEPEDTAVAAAEFDRVHGKPGANRQPHAGQ